MDENKRIKWIDVARGITIILMVIGHTSLPHYAANWIWSFHMPFFFFIAGMTLSVSRYSSFWLYLRHKIKTFMIPFAYFSIIDIFLLSSYYYENSFFEYFLEVLRYGWGGIALWFVPVLFVAELLFFFFSKLPSIILKIVSITLVSIIGSLLCKYHMILPWSMSTIFIGSAFVCMGNLLKEKISVLLCNSKILSILCIACFSIGLLISHFWRLDLFSNQINPLIPLLIGALSGILFIIIISNWIANKYTKLSSLFTYFGKNSFIIMAFSQSFMMCIIHFFRNTFTEFPLLSSSIRHCCLWILMVIAIELINKKMPWIMGRH